MPGEPLLRLLGSPLFSHNHSHSRFAISILISSTIFIVIAIYIAIAISISISISIISVPISIFIVVIINIVVSCRDFYRPPKGRVALSLSPESAVSSFFFLLLSPHKNHTSLMESGSVAECQSGRMAAWERERESRQLGWLVSRATATVPSCESPPPTPTQPLGLSGRQPVHPPPTTPWQEQFLLFVSRQIANDKP